MILILIMSTKLAGPGLLKIKDLLKECYDVIISAHYVSNKILSLYSKLFCRCGHMTKVW